MKVLMTGGGTGGHVYPAIAIANTIKNNIPKAEIAFVGTPKGIENKICRAAGYNIFHVEVKGIKRSLSPSNVKALYLAVTSPLKAKSILRSFKPDVVIGTGGYVSWPIIKAAVSEGIPTVLHESNVYPGLTVRKLQDKVDSILLNFEDTAKYLKKVEKENVLCVGNPLRCEFETVTKSEARKKLGIPENAKVLLSYGGSRGSQRMNETLVEVMKLLNDKGSDIIHIHSTGDIGATAFKEKFAEYGLENNKNIKVYPYIHNMPDTMAAADLIICRAGAMTVSEISMMKKAAIFIPSPNVVENHQYKNAKLLADKNAAMVIEEKNLSPEGLCSDIEQLLGNKKRREAMEESVRQFSNLSANRLIYDEVIKLVNEHLDEI